jgi:hypothetical protein
VDSIVNNYYHYYTTNTKAYREERERSFAFSCVCIVPPTCRQLKVDGAVTRSGSS